MKAVIELAGRPRQVELDAGSSLAIPIEPGGRHPRFFTDQTVGFDTLSIGSFTGQVSAGGSCNVETVRFIPHCHGTHTEGVGHITRDARSVQTGLETGLIPAALLTVQPEQDSSETSAGAGPMISSKALDWPEGVRALILRTLPNEDSKCRRDYAASPPYPLLSVEAMDKIVAGGIDHLLLDTPSVDAANDGGHLTQHRRFWGMASGAVEANIARAHCTITEMIFAPDRLADGLYLLSLGVSALRGDASPSAPMIYPLT